MSRRKSHGKMKKMTPEQRSKRARKQQRRAADPEYKRVEKKSGKTWSLPEVVQEQRDSRLAKLRKKFGLD